jgi:hypothetical protein
MSNGKHRDDEKAHWLIIGILFTGALLGIDIFYSSFAEMGLIAKILIGVAHGGLVVLWFIAMAKFKDPNYDVYRKYIVGLAIILALIVGIHHASSIEDKQIIIDSKENSLR